MNTDKTNATDVNKALVLAGIKGVFIDRDPTVLEGLGDFLEIVQGLDTGDFHGVS